MFQKQEAWFRHSSLKKIPLFFWRAARFIFPDFRRGEL